MNLKEQVTLAFAEKYGEMPKYIVRAPGRVNLIGEHTDYNLGYALPMAIDRAMWIALRPNQTMRVEVTSVQFDATTTFSLEDIDHSGDWSEYVRGMAWALQRGGYTLQGWDGVLVSDVPVASGLSSSAALELVVARAFWALSRWEWDNLDVVRLAQKHENEWIGIKSGVLDQMSSAFGEQGKAMLLDFQHLTVETFPMPEGTVGVVMDTRVPRGLVESAFNDRVEECRQAAEYLGVDSLREVDLETFAAKQDGMDDLIRRRARHIITENERTLQAAACLARGDVASLGQLMYESHVSLRDDYEVSCSELNLMVELARQQQGCLGARMTGGGFGGCAVALVETELAQTLAEKVARQYQAETALEPEVYICVAADGANLVA
ncbi:MAG: galactokinase [Anaerolineales bacterium]